MAKFRLRLLTLLLFVSLLLLSSVIPASKAQEVGDAEQETVSVSADEDEYVQDSVANEVVKTSEEEPKVEEELVLLSSPDVEVACVFPKHDSKLPVIPAGQLTDVVVGIVNGGESDLKVLSLEAKLVFPLDYRMIIQNFTAQKFDALVPSNAQASFSLSFTPDKHFQPRDFGFTGIILYEINGESYGSAFFNSTIEIIEPVGYVSGESIFLVLLGLALFGLFVMWLSSHFKPFPKKASRKHKKTDSGDDASENVENEWLQGTFFAVNPAVRSMRSKSKRKKIA